MDNKDLSRKMYENEITHLRLEYEYKVIELMSKNKSILNLKENRQLAKLIKKTRGYPIMGTTKVYKKSSE